MDRPITPEPIELYNTIPSAPKKKQKKKQNRCDNCNKKYGLMGFSCKCNRVFCITCKHPESHNCSFDYKLLGKELLTTKLNKVVNNKVIKI